MTRAAYELLGGTLGCTAIALESGAKVLQTFAGLCALWSSRAWIEATKHLPEKPEPDAADTRSFQDFQDPPKWPDEGEVH